MFDVDQNTCRIVNHHDWPLARFKSLIIQILPISLLTREYCDIALGPSSFLIAIEETLDEYSYVETAFDSARMENVDIYERKISTGAKIMIDDKTMLMTVRIMSQSSNESKRSEPKEDDLAGVARKDNQMYITSLIICEVRDELLENRLKNEEYKCNDKEVIVEIDYYKLSQINSLLLVGQSLEQTSEFDYHSEPFLPPVGIGCSSNPDVNPFRLGVFQKQFNAPTMKFSAEFTTSAGYKGLSYVAYDGYREILRLDSEEQNIVYDLRHRFSYYVFDKSPQSMNRINDRPRSSKGCIAIINTDETMISTRMMERLIGFGVAGQTPATYLGSRTIEQVTYEVYELELDFYQLKELNAYNLPVLLRTSRSSMPRDNVNLERRFYMTYYLTEHTKKVSITGYVPKKEDHGMWEKNNNEKVMVPKYIELWESRMKNNAQAGVSDFGHHKLINRLKFTKFSWDFDVEPSSQDLELTFDESQVFNIESCAQDRSSQLRFRFLIGEEPKSEVQGAQKLEAFKQQKAQIKEVLHEKIGDVLEISSLNIVQLDVAFANATADMMVETRIIELAMGLSVDKVLGYIKFNEIMLSPLKESMISFNENRHSLDLCKLDSLREKVKNKLMYCKGLSVCILLKVDALDKFQNMQQTSDPVLEFDLSPNVTLCEVHDFELAPKPIEKSQSALVNALENRYRLNLLKFEYYFVFNSDQQQQQPAEKVYYLGQSSSVEVKNLDPIEGLIGGNESPLVGLRYVSMTEPTARTTLSLNFNVRLTSALKEDKFEYCEKACRLEEYCESFSVCLRKNNLSDDNDCVLSTIRLTSERINMLSAAIKAGKNRDNLEVHVANPIKPDDSNQVIKFKTDNECNIYNKEILGEFKLSSSIVLPALRKTDDNNNQASAKTTPKPAEEVSLEQCAFMTYKKIQESSQQAPMNFTYCPIGSTCTLQNEPLTSSLLRDHKQVCFVYAAISKSLFYEKIVNARMRISVEGQANESNLMRAKQKITDLKIGRFFEGLTTEQCARDCNLHSSNCLAFDLCRYPNKEELCLMYSIRSPAASKNMKHGFLPQELMFYDKTMEAKKDGNLIMLATDDCTHYYFKDIFFDIKLQQMLEPSTSLYWTEVNEKDKSLLDEEKKKSDLNGLKKGVELNELDDDDGTSSGTVLYTLLLIFGLVLGFGLILYASPVFMIFCDAIEAYKVKGSRRFNGPRISLVDLANNLEL